MRAPNVREQRANMARFAVYLYAAGAALGTLTLAVPGGSARNELVILAVCAAAATAAALHLLVFERLPLWAFQVTSALATSLVTIAILFGGQSGRTYAFFYLWIVLYAFYFYPLRLALAQLALMSAAVTSVTLLAVAPSAQLTPVDPVVVVGTLGIAALLVVAIKRRVTSLVDGLLDSQAMLSDLFENANDVIATYDLDENIVSVNAAFERVLGFRREEVIGRNLGMLVAPEGLREARRQTQRKLAGEIDRTTYELEHIAKDGTRVPFEISTRLIYDDGRPVAVQGIARDLSERNRLEQRLRQSQKLEAIGQLAGGVAHDFNNRLLVIGGYTERALDRVAADDEELRSALEKVRSAAAGAASLVQQLLAFGRRQMLQPKVVQLNDVVGSTVTMLRKLIEANIEVTVALEPALPPVHVDPASLEQVLVSLAVNARDAMPEGGTLTIETARSAGRRHSDGGGVALIVRDTGTGMDGPTVARAFEPFYTTKGIGEGTGLGLASVYGLVAQNGGTVEVESTPGEGTCFTIWLPAAELLAA